MDPLRKLCREDGRYALEAYQFLFSALEEAVKTTGRDQQEGTARHVSGQELLGAMRAHGSRVYGPLAREVWRSWGIRETLDWGRVVFLLVEHQLLSRQDSDTIEDFADGFDLERAFEEDWSPALPSDEELRTRWKDEG